MRLWQFCPSRHLPAHPGRPAPVLRCALLILTMAAPASDGGCSCNDKPNPCPASFTEGDLCPQEGLVCPWPESKCQSTVCTCQNSLGGFYWKCQTSWCACTCSCGYTARTSCDSLECGTNPEDPCPGAVADVCALACSGPPDGGGGDSGPRLDGRPFDARQETTRDITSDRAADSRPDTSRQEGRSE